MPDPQTEQPPSAAPDRSSGSRATPTLGVETTVLAVVVMLGVVVMAVRDENHSADQWWILGAVALALVLLGLDWFQRRRLKAATDRAVQALIHAQGDLRDRERVLQNTLARQAKILRMEREIAGSGDPAFVGLTATRAASAVSGAKLVSMWTVDHEGDSMRLLAQSNWDHANQERGRWLPVADGAIGAAIAERQPIGVPSEDTTTWVWPLIVGNRIVGVMEVKEGPVAIDDTIGDAVSTLAIHAASSLEAARLYAESIELARVDSLTRLPNRRLFDEDLEKARELARRHGHPVSLLMIDLDRFKSINDTYGHPYGDEMLARVAEALRGGLRRSDTAYRMGGEEFAVLARETDLDGGTQLAERLRSAIEATIGTNDRGEPLLTASFGVAELGTREPDVGRMVSAADAALYDAKRGGRNRVVVVTDTTGAVTNATTNRD
jgi:diguanylate cyclase (GGDEF)-like protein